MAWLVVGLLLCAWLWSSCGKARDRPMFGSPSPRPPRSWVRRSLVCRVPGASGREPVRVRRHVRRRALPRSKCPPPAAPGYPLLTAIAGGGGLRADPLRSDSPVSQRHDVWRRARGHRRAARVGIFPHRGDPGSGAQETLAPMCTSSPLGSVGDGRCLFGLMGFGGRPLGLASFGFLALVTCAWHFRRTPCRSCGLTSGRPAVSCCSRSRRFSRCTRNRMRPRTHQVEEPVARREGGRGAPGLPAPSLLVGVGSQDQRRVHAGEQGMSLLAVRRRWVRPCPRCGQPIE